MIPTNARKKFSHNVPPSDRQLWAIGMVVVQWNAIEMWVRIFVSAFTEENNPDDPIRKILESTRSMSMKLDLWEELSRKHVKPEWLPEILKLITETRQVLDTRDKIVHGLWGDSGPFSWGRPGHPFKWNAIYGDILTVALRIDRLQSQMFELCFRASGVKDGDPFRASTALRRICSEPDRP